MTMQNLTEVVHHVRGPLSPPLYDESTTSYALTPFHVALDFPDDPRYLTILASRTESVLLLERDTYARLQARDFESIEPRHLQTLLDAALVVDGELDEVELFRLQVDDRRYFSTEMRLEVAVTEACNFRCSYCYELGTGFPNKHISTDTITTMQRWVREALSDPEAVVTDMKVNLIGGEPLLRPEKAYEVLDALKTVADEFGLPFEAVVISNGYLLTREVAEQLRDRNVRAVQITVDGPAKTHDRRRFTVDQMGTYDKIIENLNNMYDVLPIDLRINVDQENVKYISEFLDEVQQHPFSAGIKALVFPAVGDTLDDNDHIAEHGLKEDASQARLYYVLHRELIKRELGTAGFHYVPTGYFACPYFNAYSYHVETNGSLTKCALVSGRPAHYVGHISEQLGELLQELETNALELPMAEPVQAGWTDYMYAHECLDELCPYFAMCHGGCAFESLTEHGTSEIRACPKRLFKTAVHDWAGALAFDAVATPAERKAYVDALAPDTFRLITG